LEKGAIAPLNNRSFYITVFIISTLPGRSLTLSTF
jgi:hypothetical protein